MTEIHRNTQTFPPGYVWAPGTVALKDRDVSKVNLFPIPSSDPDDPLNWSSFRKFLNFGIVCSYILWTFVQLDIGYTAWGPMLEEINTSVYVLNASAAGNYAGLAVGCIFFMPFVHKYGRRPLYLFSSAVQLAGCIWQAKVVDNSGIIGANILTGLGGAICETVVQITIADIFFVHQHATMNGWYLLLTSIGAFLGPVASGYVAEGQGWRWMWWWCVIFLSIQLFVSIFFYEESKYVPQSREIPGNQSNHIFSDQKVAVSNFTSLEPVQRGNVTEVHIDPTIKRKSYLQRMAMVTKTDAPIFRHIYQPFIILFTFPAVTYTAVTFGCVLACFAILVTVQAIYLIEPPYNFGPDGVGLMQLPPFIGAFIGFFVGGWLNDKSIMWLSKRNQGIYEPEQRMWMAIPASVTIPVGLLMFGIGIANGAHWIVLAVGAAIFGFGFLVCLDIALAYCTDCYQDIIGDALVGVVFTRNAVSVVILFVLEDWLEGMGVRNLHILLACLMWAILMIPLALLKFGKRWRLWTHGRYKAMALRQPTFRTF
ncbi:hypothetical protein LTR64_004340 [Lithohypha guttulata]|uniref:uncharacterized protein n=1 Tax=Lithohypha guttulata TaxID=1690604 RepID=UPI002DDEAC9C|nr:hypothetical protein LTR51_006365 [Lithohypha guttulata]